MPINWDDTADRHLLLIMLNHVTGGKPSVKWDEIAAQFGSGATQIAVKKRWDKIRKMDTDNYTEASSSTPKSIRTIAATKRSTKAKAKASDDDDDEEEEDESPTKKMKLDQ